MEGDKNSTCKCELCGCELKKEDAIIEEGKTLCEDCYIEGHHKIQACDPWAVRSKKIFREEAGLEGTEGLTELQKAIYEFVLSTKGAKKEEIAQKFEIPLLEAENQIALLRHCELIKGQKGLMEYILCLSGVNKLPNILRRKIKTLETLS